MKFSFPTTKKTSNTWIYTCNDAVRNKFQLKLPNRFENLDINKDGTVQTAYDKSLWDSIKISAKEREKHNKALGMNSDMNLDLIE